VSIIVSLRIPSSLTPLSLFLTLFPTLPCLSSFTLPSLPFLSLFSPSFKPAFPLLFFRSLLLPCPSFFFLQFSPLWASVPLNLSLTGRAWPRACHLGRLPPLLYGSEKPVHSSLPLYILSSSINSFLFPLPFTSLFCLLLFFSQAPSCHPLPLSLAHLSSSSFLLPFSLSLFSIFPLSL